MDDPESVPENNHHDFACRRLILQFSQCVDSEMSYFATSHFFLPERTTGFLHQQFSCISFCLYLAVLMSIFESKTFMNNGLVSKNHLYSIVGKVPLNSIGHNLFYTFISHLSLLSLS
jgi:hypothetical protein